MRNLGGMDLTVQLGQDPQLVVKVEWGSTLRFPTYGGTRWYGDHDGISGLNNIEGRLISVGNISSTKKQDNIGTVGTAEITLSDDDGNLKLYLDHLLLERRPVSIYQNINNTADLLLLFKGQVISPITWSEQEHTLSFTIETIIQDNELGFAPETKDSVVGMTLNPDIVGQAWPLCFGSVVHVPTVHLTKAPRAILNQPFIKGVPMLGGAFGFEVLDGSVFPQNVTLKVNIGGVIFLGKFNQGTTFPGPLATLVDGTNVFTMSDSNLAKYTNIPFGARQAIENGENPATVAWLGSYFSIVNNYVLLNVGGLTQYFRCVRQDGLKVTFAGISTDVSGSARLLGPGDAITEVAKNGRVGWTIQTDSFITGLQNADTISMIGWHFNSGTEVKLWTGNPDLYIANLIPSTIVSVWAYRTAPNGTGRAFVHIPSTYYTKQENYSINVIDQFGNPVTEHVTLLSFHTALEDFEGQGWDEQIHVTLKSSQGPNASDVIKYLLETYSNLSVDTASFALVHTALINYPVGFAYFDVRNVMRSCEEIAWQSRCGLVVDQDVVFIRYLSVEPTVQATVSDASVVEAKLQLTFTSTEEIVTKFTASWKDTYQGLSTNAKKKIFHNNQSLYGLYARTFDFYIYNVDSLVLKSATFWSNRMSNTWRRMAVDMFLPALPFQIFDCVQFNFADGTILNPPPGGLKSIIQTFRYIPNNLPTTKLDVEFPSIGGSTIQSLIYWMSDGSDTLPVDPTTMFREVTQDLQLADFESQVRQMGATQTTIPAIVTSTTPGSDGDITVDLYGNGFSNPATRQGVQSYYVNPAAPAAVSDKLSVYSLGDRHFAQTSSGGGSTGVAGIITGGAGPVYSWAETVTPGGSVKLGGITSSATEMNGSTGIQAGTYCIFTFYGGAYYFFFPVQGCP